MARSRESKIELTAYDDLFQTDESREEAKLSKIRDIPIAEIDEFPDHPFKVLMDEDMEQLVDSIRRNGVMTPATVRLKEDGRYELISGHRRKKACELAGLDTLKCEVKELTLDEAIIVMVESNLQRSAMYLSEILRSMTAATMPRNSLSTTISLQRLSIRCEQAAWWHSLLLKVQWIRQAQRCGSISPRELSYSEQSGFPITLSEQTQARRSQAIFSFYRSVTALRI